MATIADLGAALKKKNPGKYDDLPDDALGRAMQRKHPGAYDDFTDATPSAPQSAQERVAAIQARMPAMQASAGKAADDAQSLNAEASPMAQVAGALPAVGGMLGGMAGGAGGSVLGLGVGGVPGALGGAAAGGALGEAGKQMINRGLGLDAPQNALGAAADIGKAGAVQGAMEGGGQLLGAAGRFVAPKVMALAVGLRNKGAVDLAQTAVDEGIPQGLMGMKKLKARLGEVGQEARDQARWLANDPKNWTHPLSLVHNVGDLVQQASENIGSVFPKETQGKIIGTVNKFLDENIPGGWPPPSTIANVGAFKRWASQAMLSPERLLNLRQSLNNAAEAVYKSNSNNEAEALVKDASAKVFKNLADQTRTALNTMQTPIGQRPFSEISDHLSRMIQLKNAMKGAWQTAGAAVAGSVPVAAGAAAGAALPASSLGERAKHAAIGGAATSPLLLSHLAMGMNNPLIQQLAPQLGRLAEYAAGPRTARTGQGRP